MMKENAKLESKLKYLENQITLIEQKFEIDIDELKNLNEKKVKI